MMEIATRYANGEEEDRLRSGKGKAVDTDANSNWKQKRKVESASSTEAGDDEMMYILLAPRWLPQVEG